MAEPSDYSSDLQRIFCEASHLESNHEIEKYLDQVCGTDLDQKQLITRMLRASRNRLDNPLHHIEKELVPVSDVVTELADAQTFLDASQSGFPSIPKYEIQGLLGEGAMGRVFLAEQLEPISRRVALKVIKPGMDSAQVLARFESGAVPNYGRLC